MSPTAAERHEPASMIWRRRAITIAVLILTGSVAGWIAFNLALDFLLGGRFFR